MYRCNNIVENWQTCLCKKIIRCNKCEPTNFTCGPSCESPPTKIKMSKTLETEISELKEKMVSVVTTVEKNI